MRRLALLVLALALATACGGATAPQRPELQHLLDELVTGEGRAAPGATAVVSGPRGEWAGAAGLANVETGERMRPDARMRLESVSKLWAAVVALRLQEDGVLDLDDTVERHVPGLLPDGARITLRQLLNHTSGLVDNNDFTHDSARYLREVDDDALRAELLREGRAWARDRNHEFPTDLTVRWAAEIPLLHAPGSVYRYSNIGYIVAGEVLEAATGETFAELVARLIVEPLDLESAAHDPRSRITGDHSHGYAVARGGTLEDTTGVVADLGPQGGIVASARDEARFLEAVFGGDLLEPGSVRELKTAPAGSDYGLGTGIVDSVCAGTAYAHGGGGDAFTTHVVVSGDGRRVAVLLLNGRTPDGYGDELARGTARRLFCAG